MKSKEVKLKQLEEIGLQILNNQKNLVNNLDELLEFIQFRNNFPDYSIRNCILIHAQFPNAIGIGSYGFHKSQGHHVKRGAKAIKILAPVIYEAAVNREGTIMAFKNKFDADVKNKLQKGVYRIKKIVTGFKVTNVFDLQQTTCPHEKYPQHFKKYFVLGENINHLDVKDALENYAKKLGVELLSEPLKATRAERGTYYPDLHAIHINVEPSTNHYLKTLIHELAHSQLHRISELTIPEKELQAELVAGIVCQYFGIDAMDASANYIKSWTKGNLFEKHEALFQEVIDLACSITQFVEQQLDRTRDKQTHDITFRVVESSLDSLQKNASYTLEHLENIAKDNPNHQLTLECMFYLEGKPQQLSMNYNTSSDKTIKESLVNDKQSSLPDNLISSYISQNEHFIQLQQCPQSQDTLHRLNTLRENIYQLNQSKNVTLDNPLQPIVTVELSQEPGLKEGTYDFNYLNEYIKIAEERVQLLNDRSDSVEYKSYEVKLNVTYFDENGEFKQIKSDIDIGDTHSNLIDKLALYNDVNALKKALEKYDLLALDKDNDGVIDRYDADERNPDIQEIGDLYELDR
ncbi:hypothetical protein NHG34_08220 [Aerococcaceae bacterium NML190938]|nr:hypothetical protein [Aerococcaceae bacterium NML190938]